MNINFIDVDKWQEIFKTLQKQKLRTLLTAFGVFWGIFMLVVLLGFGKGFGQKTEESFGDRKNVVFLWASNPTQMPFEGFKKGRRILLNDDDIQAIREKIRGINLVDGTNEIEPQYVVHNKNHGSFNVYGSHAGWEKLNNNAVVEGRYINQQDEKEFRKVTVIGTRVKDILFKGEKNAIGEQVKVGGIYFTVVGIYKGLEPDEGDRNQSNSLILPNRTLRKVFNQSNQIGDMWIQPLPGVKAEKLETEVKKLLYERQKIHPKDVGVLRTYNVEKEFQEQQQLVSGILGFSWLVAIGTIIAGVIGVGNIMLIVVKERTREIGLRKALGATPRAISAMIVQESLFITVVAGYTGLVAGVLVLEFAKTVFIKLGKQEGMFAAPFVDVGTALLALAVLVIAGAVASYLPARKAASVNPILALQDE